MVTELPEPTIEWLSLVRYQMMVATEQSSLSRPLNAFALNTAQDAVESALSLVIQTRGADIKNRPDFLQSFEAAMTHARDPVVLKEYRPSMNALNNARVSFKHHGNLPDQQAVKRHVSRAVDFIETLVNQIFKIDINSVSLLVFIKSAEVRELLVNSQAAWDREDDTTAMAELARGFEELIHDYTQRKRWSPGQSLFATKPRFYPTWTELRGAGKAVERMDEWLNNLDTWVKYTALGVDMRRYAYFEAHTPRVSRKATGKDRALFRSGITIDSSVYGRCLKFVVDTGIALAGDDYDFDHWEARRGGSKEE